jgi:putative membrane protein
MRTKVIHGLAAFSMLAAYGCSNPQQPKDPINSDPKPQKAFSDPKPQSAAIDTHHGAQKPAIETSPQTSAFQDPTPQQPINEPTPQKPFYGPGLTEGESGGSKAKQQLASDGEVLGFAVALNDGEIQLAELAKKKATDAQVKKFAAMMSSHHQQGMTKARSVQSKTKVTLESSDLETKVKSDAGQNLAMLRDKSGKEFDRLYIDSQVRMHKDALDHIDAQVLPAVSSGEVKTSVQDMRRTISDHLAKAEEIQKRLDPTTAAARDDGKKVDSGKGKGETKSDKEKNEQKKDATDK